MGGRGRGVAMRVVASGAAKGVVTLSEAAAPGQGRTLEPYGGRVVSSHRTAKWAVALRTECNDPGTSGQAGACNRRVGELGLDGDQVVAARAMTPFAANSARRPVRAGRFHGRFSISDVAKKAAADRVLGQRPAKVITRIVRMLDMPRGHIPTGSAGTGVV